MSAQPLPTLSAGDRAALLALARRAIAARLEGHSLPPTDELPESLREARDAFVTLHVDGRLHGCIGRLEADRPLFEVVVHCAVGAATEDPRFPPLAIGDLERLKVEISVLSHPVVVESVDQIEAGRHGVIVSRGRRQGLLLPQVATEQGWDRTTLLRQTCRKAGLPPDAWEHGARLQKFEAEVFAEELAPGSQSELDVDESPD
ncbi:MAG TPA: AmmeMemoRadiSam system protein A [Candidatus Polarisedimenticolia bacterium]|nr:AmmeMemoRadiSam system protein A [Candidatus Polarisedimenticolia bacterium]